MRARRGARSRLNPSPRESSSVSARERGTLSSREEREKKYGKCGSRSAARRPFLRFLFPFFSPPLPPPPEKKETDDKRDRGPFELNMGSKRSAVILISYIYKSIKREQEGEKGRSFKTLFFFTLVHCLIINYTDGIYNTVFCGFFILSSDPLLDITIIVTIISVID